jgi:hypothetical protein
MLPPTRVWRRTGSDQVRRPETVQQLLTSRQAGTQTRLLHWCGAEDCKNERTVSPKVTTEHPRVSHTVFRQFNNPGFTTQTRGFVINGGSQNASHSLSHLLSINSELPRPHTLTQLTLPRAYVPTRARRTLRSTRSAPRRRSSSWGRAAATGRTRACTAAASACTRTCCPWAWRCTRRWRCTCSPSESSSRQHALHAMSAAHTAAA